MSSTKHATRYGYHRLFGQILTNQDPNDFPLKDHAGEERLGFKLKTSLERASSLKQKLFAHCCIFVSPNLGSTADVVCKLILENGGTSIKYSTSSRGTIMDTDKIIMHALVCNEDPTSLKAEEALSNKFCLQVDAIGKRPILINRNWVLNSVLKQELLPFEEYAFPPT